MATTTTITRELVLFGKKIEVQVPVEEEEQGENQAQMVRTRSGLELPVGAFLAAKKKLTDSDVSPSQGRLLIPNCPELFQFLTEQEKTLVSTPKQGVRVTILDNQQRQYQMNLVQWQSVNKLVLNRGWNEAVKVNNLREFDDVELWFFRDNDQLRCALDIWDRGHQQQQPDHHSLPPHSPAPAPALADDHVNDDS